MNLLAQNEKVQLKIQYPKRLTQEFFSKEIKFTFSVQFKQWSNFK